MIRWLAIFVALLPAAAFAQPHWGTFPDGGTLVFFTNTIGTDGAPETPASETLVAYNTTNDTELTTGVAVDDDYDSRTGFHRLTVDTTQSGFDAGGFYTLVYGAGTSDSVSIAGRVVGSFRLTTAESVAGVPKVDASHVAGTSQTAGDIIGDTNDIQTRLPSSAAATNMTTVFATDFASNYNTADDAWAVDVEFWSGQPVQSSVSGLIPADVVRISDDATAADNAELFFDGTGYAGTNNVIPTVTSVTNQVTANATAISGDTTAADNLEAAADGTGYNLGGGSVVAASVTGFNVNGSGLTSIPWNAAWDAEVQSEVNDEILLQNLDHLVKSAVDTDFATTVQANSVIGHLADNGAGFDRTTDSQEAIRDNMSAGSADWTADERTAIRTILGVPGSGTTPADPTDGILDDIRDAVAGISVGAAPNLLQTTTIATLASQTSFTLTAGSTDNDAFNGALAVFVDQATNTQKAFELVKDYVGSTRTVTLRAAPAFTIATGDTVHIIATDSKPLSLELVPPIRTWKFDNRNQLSASNNVTIAAGDDPVVAMDFTNAMHANDSIDTVDSVSIADIVGETEPVLGTAEKDSTAKKVNIPANAVSATGATYTVTARVTTVDGQVLIRTGRLVVQE